MNSLGAFTGNLGHNPEVRILKGERNRINVAFPYDPFFVEKVKPIKGRRWHPEERFWSLPNTPDALVEATTIYTQQILSLGCQYEQHIQGEQ